MKAKLLDDWGGKAFAVGFGTGSEVAAGPLVTLPVAGLGIVPFAHLLSRIRPVRCRRPTFRSRRRPSGWYARKKLPPARSGPSPATAIPGGGCHGARPPGRRAGRGG